MIQDLHSHTYYSFCGKDSPEIVIETAIENGIEVLGICDHNYGIGMQQEEILLTNHATQLTNYQRCLETYYNHLKLLAEKYKDQIRLLIGIEVATINKPHLLLPKELDISLFDYCLIEHIDKPDTVVDDLFDFVTQCNFPTVGIAHTDIPTYLERTKQKPLDFFTKMANNNIFWEMNVNYDSIHGYHEHEYVCETLNNQTLIDILKTSGVKLSVGFDGHRIEDYLPERVINCCQKIASLGLNLVAI